MKYRHILPENGYPEWNNNPEITNLNRMPIHATMMPYDNIEAALRLDSEDQITHNIFYTAVTRARKHLTIYWSPEVCNRILVRIRPVDYKQDFYLLKAKNDF